MTDLSLATQIYVLLLKKKSVVFRKIVALEIHILISEVFLGKIEFKVQVQTIYLLRQVYHYQGYQDCCYNF